MATAFSAHLCCDQPFKTLGPEGQRPLKEHFEAMPLGSKLTHSKSSRPPGSFSVEKSRYQGKLLELSSPQAVGTSLAAWKTWMGITKRMNDHISPKERNIPGSSESSLQRLGHIHRLAGTDKHRATPQFAAPPPVSQKPSTPELVCNPLHAGGKANLFKKY